MNKDFMLPSKRLKLHTPTKVSIASPELSNRDSIESEPSFIWYMKKLRISITPYPRFFFIGDSIIVMNE